MAHGGQDATACSQDFEVSFSLQALLEFNGAVACPHGMGVGVYKTRQDSLAARVESRFIGISKTQLAGVANRGDQAIPDQYCAIVDQAEAA
jgi:hypothetical protein